MKKGQRESMEQMKKGQKERHGTEEKDDINERSFNTIQSVERVELNQKRNLLGKILIFA